MYFGEAAPITTRNSLYAHNTGSAMAFALFNHERAALGAFRPLFTEDEDSD